MIFIFRTYPLEERHSPHREEGLWRRRELSSEEEPPPAVPHGACGGVCECQFPGTRAFSRALILTFCFHCRNFCRTESHREPHLPSAAPCCPPHLPSPQASSWCHGHWPWSLPCAGLLGGQAEQATLSVHIDHPSCTVLGSRV